MNVAEQKLTARLHQEGKPIGEPKIFELTERHARLPRARLRQARRAPARPGRALQSHLGHALRPRPHHRSLARCRSPRTRPPHSSASGIAFTSATAACPAWVSAVDDEQEIVTVTLFGNVDPALFADLKLNAPIPKGMPPETKTKPGSQPLRRRTQPPDLRPAQRPQRRRDPREQDCPRRARQQRRPAPREVQHAARRLPPAPHRPRPARDVDLSHAADRGAAFRARVITCAAVEARGRFAFRRRWRRRCP